MKDLYRCLDDYAKELLLAIAGAWGIALPNDETMRMVKRLGDAMLAPGAIGPVVSSLSPEARASLAYLAAQGGAAPARPTALRYGALRRLGPARLRREKPWLEPAGPLEELYYRGLVYRAYGQIGQQVGDLILIPDELLALLPPLESATVAGATQRRPDPACVRAEGQAMLEDMLATIVWLRRQPLLSQGTPETGELAELAANARLLGSAEDGRLRALWRALVAQGLIEHDGRQWRPALGARQWLRQSDAEQWLATWMAWRDDEGWDELLRLPSIVCEPVGWQNRPAQARRRLCAILAGYTPGVWYDLESLLAALRTHHPDYLRPDGDLDSWLVRDAQTGAYLRGIESWDRVEGALARHLLLGPLHWLGVVDLGDDTQEEASPAARLTQVGKQLLAGRSPAEPAPQGEPLATLDDQLAIRISARDTRYQRYQLERLAEWQGRKGDAARYLLTEDSVWQGLNAGIQGEQIRAFLRRIVGGSLPELAERTLAAWAGRFGRVSLRRAVALEAEDEATMREIRQAPELAPLLGQAISPTLCLVNDEHLDDLIAGLKQRGIWPRIRR